MNNIYYNQTAAYVATGLQHGLEIGRLLAQYGQKAIAVVVEKAGITLGAFVTTSAGYLADLHVFLKSAFGSIVVGVKSLMLFAVAGTVVSIGAIKMAAVYVAVAVASLLAEFVVPLWLLTLKVTANAATIVLQEFRVIGEERGHLFAQDCLAIAAVLVMLLVLWRMVN